MDICNKNLAYSQMQVYVFIYGLLLREQQIKNSTNPEIAWRGGGVAQIVWNTFLLRGIKNIRVIIRVLHGYRVWFSCSKLDFIWGKKQANKKQE